MKRLGGIRTLLVAAIVLVLLLHLVAQPDARRRSFQILPDMLDSVPYEAQGSNPNFANLRNLRQPAPGTAARGYPAFRYATTPEDALRAGAELTNPFNADDDGNLARGAFVYETFCQVCHGADGSGRAPVTARGVPPPPALLAEHAVTMKDGQMYHLITLGQGNMAPYAAQVERSDRWKVILHIRSMQRAAKKGASR